MAPAILLRPAFAMHLRKLVEPLALGLKDCLTGFNEDGFLAITQDESADGFS